MNRFLLGALAMGAVFVLTSFAFRLPVASAAPKDGPAWTVSDYRLDRAFRLKLPDTGSTGTYQTLTFQIPTGAGFILTQVHPYSTLIITVNGVEEHLSVNNSGSTTLHDLNPPIICRPGDVVSVFYGSAPIVAGYTTYPGET